MQLKPKDPLLAAARILLVLAQASSLVAAAGCAIGAVALAVLREDIVPAFISDGMGSNSIWLIVAILVLIGGALVLGFYFFRHLGRIVGTVGQGDPFIPSNAKRLSAMGWIAVATHLIIILAMILSNAVEVAAKHNRDDIDFGLLFGGILLALILFVLSRVFREGARMRDELEGTV